MNDQFDNIITERFEIQGLYKPNEVRATATGYEIAPPPELADVAVEDVSQNPDSGEGDIAAALAASGSPGPEDANILDEFGEFVGDVATTFGDTPNMLVRGIINMGVEGAYSSGLIDKNQADFMRKRMKLSGKIAEGEGVNSIVRNLGEGLAQFGAGMAGPFKALKAVGVARPLAALIAEGISGAFAFNPDDPNLGNFINSFKPENPVVKNIADFLQTDPKDTEAENRFRNLVQDVVPSAIVESIVKGVKTVREMDPDAIIKAGEAAENRLSEAMSGTTLSANPLGAVADAAIAGTGKVAQKLKSPANIIEKKLPPKEAEFFETMLGEGDRWDLKIDVPSASIKVDESGNKFLSVDEKDIDAFFKWSEAFPDKKDLPNSMKVSNWWERFSNKTGVNVADDGTLTFNGKQIEEWTPADFKNAGKEMGIKRLGPGSKPQEFKLTDGTTFNIPGGLKGKFTYYDMLQMKADGIDASKIPEKLHVEIQKKMSRSLSMDKLSDEQVWAGLAFGITSPNNPLFPNQLAMSRLRGKDAIDELANSISWKFGDDVDPAVREAADKEIAAKFNLNAGDKGGLGVRGTQNYTRVAEMAKLFKENPEFFRRQKNEPWGDFAERIFSQVSGLRAKTGSFSVVFQDPLVAGISAIDRHMARLFQDKILADPKDRLAWQKRSISLFNERNKGKGIPKAKTMNDLTDGFIGELILSEVGKTSSPKFRLASGEINPNVPKRLQEADWIEEPKQIEMMGAQYKAALQANQEEAMKQGLGIFSSQWMLWDRARRRLEPHENMFPGLEKMPRPSVEQAKKANIAHKESGHKDYTKETINGEKRLRPTKSISNPSSMAYFSLPLAFFALQGEEK